MLIFKMSQDSTTNETIQSQEIFINKKVWSTFSAEEKDQYMEKVFQYYRKNGFPYFPTSSEYRKKELDMLTRYDYKKCIDEPNKTIKQSMHGLSFCWSFHPYHYEIQCNQMKTPHEVFHNDSLFHKVIEKRMRMGDNMSDNGIRKMLKVFTGTQCVSNFRPTAAAAIYEYFSNPNDTVLDMSFGFGGRLLGAFLAKRNYIGFDPSVRAMKANMEMKSFLENYFKNSDQNNFPNNYDLASEAEQNNYELINQGSEIAFTHSDGSQIKPNSIDLCFTSPPYFNCEKYSNEPTQSYLQFPDKTSWLENFLGCTMENCFHVLKPEHQMIINIQNVKSFPTLVEETKNLAMRKGFVFVDEWKLSLSQLGTGGYKYEPLLIFRKP